MCDYNFDCSGCSCNISAPCSHCMSHIPPEEEIEMDKLSLLCHYCHIKSTHPYNCLDIGKGLKLPRCPHCHSLMTIKNIVDDIADKQDTDVFGYNKK